ncbi:helix-turn-helix domain-containing protein [Nocardioides sp.]|uniref:helix-turn-helix domain-containing protein n=1 Tax=Nocardioides sp. TaxID=35761 RepID=UPI0039C9E5C9
MTKWRLALAVDLLAASELPLDAIAAGAAYANPCSLSAAFKRIHGLSPSSYRVATATWLAAQGPARGRPRPCRR